MPDERVLCARLDSAVRRAIRKAERAGLEVRREQSREAVEIYYDLHCRTRKKHGLPPQPISFFHNLHRHLIERDLGEIFLAYHQGRPVAGAVFLRSFRQALYKFGASDEANLELRANNLVLWTAIRHYAERGFQTLDLGRTSLDQSGLRRYKLGWGATETTIAYVNYDLRHDQFLVGRDRSTGWHTALFRRLPIPVLRWLGACLYPHLT
ncbi:MAG: GNAT family N-acetyltransferase [Verrucomicrobia bacterium]|nr:GNAT family N-acetyltransferase [Verrucomicrobiota bacterium]